MARPAPVGPLIGDEELLAIQELTDRQLRAYRYRRSGEALNWIAQRMGISRTAVVHHIAKAERKLGYEPSVTAKQKAPYKSVAVRRSEADDAWIHQLREAVGEMDSTRRRAFIRAAYPSADIEGMDKNTELRVIAEIYLTAASDPAAAARLQARLQTEQRVRRRREAEDELLDWSSAVGENESDFAAELEADFGSKPDGTSFSPGDFVVDDGRGYDRL